MIERNLMPLSPLSDRLPESRRIRRIVVLGTLFTLDRQRYSYSFKFSAR